MECYGNIDSTFTKHEKEYNQDISKTWDMTMTLIDDDNEDDNDDDDQAW